MKPLNTIQKKIMAYIDQHDETSFVELENIFDDCSFDWCGNQRIASSECNNLWFWTGWNKPAVRLVVELLHSHMIEMRQVSPNVYYIDGITLKVPVANRQRFYKTPHWLPVAFTSKRTSTKRG